MWKINWLNQNLTTSLSHTLMFAIFGFLFDWFICYVFGFCLFVWLLFVCLIVVLFFVFVFFLTKHQLLSLPAILRKKTKIPKLSANVKITKVRKIDIWKNQFKKFGSRGGQQNIDDDRCAKMSIHVLAKSKNWTNLYACSSWKFIINNEFLVYIHSLYFPMNIYLTKIVQFHIS